MKKGFLTIILYCLLPIVALADSYWKNSFALKQTEEWYGSDEAVRIAENVLIYQRESGGWPKNVEMHEVLTDAQKEEITAQKSDLSCFDNGATTTEMRFLAKVYKHIPNERYIEAFNRGLRCLIEAQSLCGSGWPQYWPQRGGTAGSSYSDFITFNDNTTVNIMKMMRDVVNDQGDFSNITTHETRLQAEECFDKGLQCILDCQIRTDEGDLTVWCAQHDPVTLLPAVARNYEMPSYSGAESANILKFLMSIENPSEAVIQAIEGGVRWFENNALEDKAIEEFTNEAGEKDIRIVDAEGKRLWGRFVQIGGEVGKRTYEALFDFLEAYGVTRSYDINGKIVEYRDVDNARNSYDPTKANQPIYCHKAQEAGCAYRFGYNFNDTPPVTDEHGALLPTSLCTYDRTSYSFVGTWGESLFNNYQSWKETMNNTTLDTLQSTYALREGETFASGTTIKLAHISLTYGETGGADFLTTINTPYDERFTHYTPGNNVNGNKQGGTFYTFRPLYDGKLSVCIKHNLVKPLFVEEDGIAMLDFNGITFDNTHPSSYMLTFPVKAGKTYKLYCQGSKLGFYGFEFFEQDNSDGISQTTEEWETESRIYDLNGRQIHTLQPGINIVTRMDAKGNVTTHKIAVKNPK